MYKEKQVLLSIFIKKKMKKCKKFSKKYSFRPAGIRAEQKFSIELDRPRSSTPDHKRPFFTEFRPFGSDNIMVVFCRAVNDQILVFSVVFDCFWWYTIRQKMAARRLLLNEGNTGRSRP